MARERNPSSVAGNPTYVADVSYFDGLGEVSLVDFANVKDQKGILVVVNDGQKHKFKDDDVVLLLPQKGKGLVELVITLLVSRLILQGSQVAVHTKSAAL